MPLDSKRQPCVSTDLRKAAGCNVPDSCLCEDHVTVLWDLWAEYMESKDQSRNIASIRNDHRTASQRYRFLRTSTYSGERNRSNSVALNVPDVEWIMQEPNSSDDFSPFIKFVREDKQVMKKLQMNFKPIYDKGVLDTEVAIAVLERFEYWLRDSDSQRLNILGVTDSVRVDPLEDAAQPMSQKLRNGWGKHRYHIALISLEDRWSVFLVDQRSGKGSIEYFDPNQGPTTNLNNTLLDTLQSTAMDLDFTLETKMVEPDTLTARRDCSALCFLFLEKRLVKNMDWAEALRACREADCDDVLSKFLDMGSNRSQNAITDGNKPFDYRLAAVNYIKYLQYVSTINPAASAELNTKIAELFYMIRTPGSGTSIPRTIAPIQQDLKRRMPTEFSGDRWLTCLNQVVSDPLTKRLRNARQVDRQKIIADMLQELINPAYGNFSSQTEAYAQTLIQDWYHPLRMAADARYEQQHKNHVFSPGAFLQQCTTIPASSFAAHFIRSLNEWLISIGRPNAGARINAPDFRLPDTSFKPFTQQTMGAYRANFSACDQVITAARAFLQSQGVPVAAGLTPLIPAAIPALPAQNIAPLPQNWAVPAAVPANPWPAIAPWAVPALAQNQWPQNWAVPAAVPAFPQNAWAAPAPAGVPALKPAAGLPAPMANSTLPQMVPAAQTNFLAVAPAAPVKADHQKFTVKNMVEESLDRMKDADTEANYQMILQRMKDLFERSFGLALPVMGTEAYDNVTRIINEAMKFYVGAPTSDTFEGLDSRITALVVQYLNAQINQLYTLTDQPMNTRVRLFLLAFCQFAQSRYKAKAPMVLGGSSGAELDQAMRKFFSLPNAMAQFVHGRLDLVYRHLGFTPPAHTDPARSLFDQAILQAGGAEVLKYGSFKDVTAKWGTLTGPMLSFLKRETEVLSDKLKLIPLERDRAMLFLYVFASYMRTEFKDGTTGAAGAPAAEIPPATDRLTTIKLLMLGLVHAKLQPLRESSKFEAWYFPLDVQSVLNDYAAQFAWRTNLAQYSVSLLEMPKLTNDRDFKWFYGFNVLEVIQMMKRKEFTVKREQDALLMATSLQQQLTASDSDDTRGYFCELVNELYRTMNEVQWSEDMPSFSLLSSLVALSCASTGVTKRYIENLYKHFEQHIAPKM